MAITEVRGRSLQVKLPFPKGIFDGCVWAAWSAFETRSAGAFRAWSARVRPVSI